MINDQAFESDRVSFIFKEFSSQGNGCTLNKFTHVSILFLIERFNFIEFFLLPSRKITTTQYTITLKIFA
jgi:hypothetical protein